MKNIPVHKRPKVRRIMRQGVADVIANSEFYNQSTFGYVSMLNPCESECCLAGFIDWRANPKAHLQAVVYSNTSLITKRVDDILSLTEEDWPKVFYVSSAWPKPFADQYYLAESPKKKALALRDRVEHWFKTGE